MSQNSYVYEALDHSTPSFRLLRIQDPSRDGVIRCSLRNEIIADNTYRALSYVWNPAPTSSESSDGNRAVRSYSKALKQPRSILINNKLLHIGNNLYSFLEVAQHQYAASDIWIDAICIDQGNVAERNHQVKQMAEIYTKAHEVIAWLGPGDSDTKRFLDFVNESISAPDNPFTHMVISGRLEAEDKIEQPSFKKRCLDLFRKSEGRCNICRKVDTIKPGFCKMLRNQYWDRLWIVQEVLLAKNIQIKCGRVHAPFWQISAALSIQEDDELAPLEYRLGGGNFGDVRVRRARGDPRGYLYEMMSRLSQRKCTEVHDHLYGLIGVSLDCQDLEVDYSRTTPELLEYVLERANMPNFLCGSTIAKVLGVFPDDALASLEPEFLEKKICIQETASYARVKRGEGADTEIISITDDSPLFEGRPMFHRCQNENHSLSTSHGIPVENDILIQLPKIGLKAVFHPGETDASGFGETSTRLSFVCCIDAVHHRENAWFCSIADDLYDVMKLLKPLIPVWHSNDTMDVVWEMDWRTVFTISKYTGWKGYFEGLVLNGRGPEPHWNH